MQINSLNNSQPYQPIKDNSQSKAALAWLATIPIGLGREVYLSLQGDFSWFYGRELMMIGGSALAGFFVRKLHSAISSKNMTTLVAVANCTNAYFRNGFSYEANGFSLGVLLGEYFDKRIQKTITKKQEQNQLPLDPNKTIYAKLISKLDEKVFGQAEAKVLLAKAVASHYEKLMIPSMASILGKGNILLMGPSGSGKTLMMQTIGDALGLPVAMIDASRLTPEGYIGSKFDDAFRQLYEKSNQNINLAEKGIVFIDEIDKAFKSNDREKNTFSTIQNQLLTSLQGTEIKFKTSDTLFFGDTKTINTKNILFVMAGSFGELCQTEPKIKPTADSSIAIPDLLNYGLKPEFVGRIGHVIQLNPLTAADYRRILLSKESNMSLQAWKNEFEKNQLVLDVEDAIIDKIVDYAWQSETGVRSLDFVLRQLITPILIESIEKKRSGELKAGTCITIRLEDWLKTTLGQQQESHFPTIGDLKSALDEQVVGQQEAKNTVVQALYLHYFRQKDTLQTPLPKSNVLLIGPSGTGKTFIVEVLSKKLGLPLAILDASKLTREGIVGPKSNDAIVSLLEQTKGNVAKAERGVIFLDEIDKVFGDSLKEANTIVSGKSIQNQLLGMLQGDQVTVDYNSERKTVNTKNILFIMAGAFSQLTHNAKQPLIDDQTLLTAGITPEFLGRIGSIARLYPLTADEIKMTLTKGSKAPLTSWINLFERHGARLILAEKTAAALVEAARKKVTGIRGLHFELQKAFDSAFNQNDRAPDGATRSTQISTGCGLNSID